MIAVMRTRWIAILATFAALATGCGDDGDPSVDATSTTSAALSTTAPSSTAPSSTTTEAAPSTTTTVAGLDRPTVERCDAWADSGAERTLTFVAANRLWAVDAAGDVTCLADDIGSDPVAWSPTGDRLLTAAGSVRSAGGAVDLGTGDEALLGWTWPTGRRVLTTDGPTLTKHEADGSGVSDATIADDHRVLAYHPDGVHFAVFGTAEVEFEEFDESGDSLTFTAAQTGLFIVRNNEPRPQLMIDPVGAVIRDVIFSEDGTRLTFVADHDGEFHLHSFDLPEMLIETDDGELLLTALPEDPDLIEPQVESDRPLDNLTVDPADPWRMLFSTGGPSLGHRVQLYDFAGDTLVDVAPGLDAVPVGFLDATTVAVHSVDDELWIVDLATDDRTLVAVGVGGGAIRDAAPGLAFSLVDVTIVGFA